MTSDGGWQQAILAHAWESPATGRPGGPGDVEASGYINKFPNKQAKSLILKKKSPENVSKLNSRVGLHASLYHSYDLPHAGS